MGSQGWARVQQLRESRSLPTRETIQKWATHPALDPISAVEANGLSVAMELGLFDPEVHAEVLDIGRCVVADGTVVKPPTDNAHPETLDPDTQVVHRRHHDPATAVYHQGGGERVVGPKFAHLLGATPDECSHELILSVIPVSAPDPKAEATAVAGALLRISGQLERTASRRWLSALVMDGAPDSEINRLLTSHGIGLLAPPAKKAEGKQRTHTIGRFKHPKAGNVQLRLVGSQIVQLVNVEGELAAIPVPSRWRRVNDRRGGTPHVYVEVTLMSEDILRMPMTRMTGNDGQPEETEAQYERRLSLLRAAQSGDDAWRATQHCMRGMVEGMNSRLDAQLPHKRIPAYGYHNQLCRLAYRSIATNLCNLAQYRTARTAAPPGRAA